MHVRPPCTLAPSLGHNTGSIDSWAPSFPACMQNCGLVVPAHGPLAPQDPPRKGGQSWLAGWSWVDTVPKGLMEGRKKEEMDTAPIPESSGAGLKALTANL